MTAPDRSPATPEQLLEAALAYARQGWPVVPLHTPVFPGGGEAAACSCGRADCPSTGKHPRTPSGLKDATTDEAVIRAWWARWPDANIGVVTGAASGTVVLDVDPRHGGHTALAELQAQRGELPHTVMALTGGGGEHHVFAHPGGSIKNGEIGPGLDVKADGGYIVVEPSLHPSGRRYSWELSSRPGETMLAPVPIWLDGLLKRRSEAETRPEQPAPFNAAWKQHASRSTLQFLAFGAEEGQRNKRLFAACCDLAGHGLTAEQIRAEAGPPAARCGLGEEEIEAVVRSACSQPRTPSVVPEPTDEQYADPHGDIGAGSWVSSVVNGSTATPPATPQSGERASPDSIRAPIQKDPARIAWTPVPVTDLGPGEPPDWLWPGYLARGYLTLFIGLWKAGKTTMVANLLRDLEHGGGLVGDAAPGVKVLVITEETRNTWCRRRDDLGLTANTHTMILPFMGRPDNATWRAFIDCVCGLIGEHKYQLVVFDTLATFWSVQNENDASEVGSALLPLRQLTNLNCAVLLVHHPRKGGGEEGQASRGSGSLPGFVDALVELRRFNKTDLADTRRVLTVLSRLEDAPGETVWDWKDGRYTKVGDQSVAQKADRMLAIEQVLPKLEPGMTAEEVREAWRAEHRPGKRALEVDLGDGARSGRWRRTGTGRKGDPYRYYAPPTFDSRKVLSIGARNESDPPQPLDEGEEGEFI